jgi:hypothetical protein
MARLDAPLVFVEWHDAHAGGSNWMSIEEIEPEPCVVWTAGFLLPSAKPGHVAIAQSLADSGDFDSPLYIPADMVIRTVVMGNPPPRDT